MLYSKWLSIIIFVTYEHVFICYIQLYTQLKKTDKQSYIDIRRCGVSANIYTFFTILVMNIIQKYPPHQIMK